MYFGPRAVNLDSENNRLVIWDVSYICLFLFPVRASLAHRQPCTHLLTLQPRQPITDSGAEFVGVLALANSLQIWSVMSVGNFHINYVTDCKLRYLAFSYFLIKYVSKHMQTPTLFIFFNNCFYHCSTLEPSLRRRRSTFSLARFI